MFSAVLDAAFEERFEGLVLDLVLEGEVVDENHEPRAATAQVFEDAGELGEVLFFDLHEPQPLPAYSLRTALTVEDLMASEDRRGGRGGGRPIGSAPCSGSGLPLSLVGDQPFERHRVGTDHGPELSPHHWNTRWRPKGPAPCLA